MTSSTTNSTEKPSTFDPLETARNQVAWVRGKLGVAVQLTRDEPWHNSLLRTLLHAIDIDHPLLRHLYKKEDYMTPVEFESFAEKFVDDQNELLNFKGQDYCGDGDRLANFRRQAAGLGLTPLQVWAVFFMKHVDALCNLARSGVLHSEPPRSRFLDVANYAILGCALFEDEKKGDKEVGA